VIDQTETLTMTESLLALEEKEENEGNFYKKISSIIDEIFFMLI